MQQLYERAHEYANLANRAKPVVTDVLAASDDYNLEAGEIYRLSKKSKKRKRSTLHFLPLWRYIERKFPFSKALSILQSSYSHPRPDRRLQNCSVRMTRAYRRPYL